MCTEDWSNKGKGMSKDDFDPLDNEKTLYLNLEDSLGDMPTMNLYQSGIGRVDRYELLEKLGEGGFGAVYGARDTEANILVALKALPAEVSCDADEMNAIRDNFSLVSKLHHPNIASLLHLHRVERVDERAAVALGVHSGDYLVVMEYAPGATLFALRRAMTGQKLDFFQALEIARPIAEALDFAHSLKILHRDIKPKNVMVGMATKNTKTHEKEPSEDSVPAVVKVLDFGLAAEIRSSMSRKSKDPQNSKSGTPLYMAPEQWEGKRQDGRADQYALAALFYELVSGEVPFKSAFDSGSFEIMRSVVLSESVTKLKELNKNQNVVLLRALSKDPAARFGSCGEFVEALAGGKFRPRIKRGSSKKMFFGICVVAIMGAAYWFSGQIIPKKPTNTLPIIEKTRQIENSEIESTPNIDSGAVDVPKTNNAVLSVILSDKVFLKMVRVSAGTYMRGSLSSEKGRDSDEIARTIELTRDFYIGKVEVTQAQYKTVMQRNPSINGDLDWPVNNVNWYRATDFCKKLNKNKAELQQMIENSRIDGGVFRLPTEAEWEYAARAETDQSVIGSLPDYAWYKSNSEQRAHRSGSLLPNAWGANDMQGNVWEWCFDDYADYSDRKGTDPVFVGEEESKIIRGGSFKTQAEECRFANRERRSPAFTSETIGFRVVFGQKIKAKEDEK